jgi:hypothetical protein
VALLLDVFNAQYFTHTHTVSNYLELSSYLTKRLRPRARAFDWHSTELEPGSYRDFHHDGINNCLESDFHTSRSSLWLSAGTSNTTDKHPYFYLAFSKVMMLVANRDQSLSDIRTSADHCNVMVNP